MDDSYFESMYADDADPWGFETSWYERRKYDLTLAALTRAQYRHAYEPGCANGVFTERLARRCDRVTACDIVPAVVERARHRTERFPRVEVSEERFPSFWPAAGGDLVVWSEVAYYLSADSLREALDRLDRWLDDGGELVVVNYTGVTNYPLTADDVAGFVERDGRLQRHTSSSSDGFRLDVWIKPTGDMTA